MPNYNFREDFPIAQKTEQEVAKILEKQGAIILEYNNDNKYDLKINWKGQEITIEIKEDFTCERTWNVGLEFSCRGKDSGIAVTQADYYVYKIHEPCNRIHFYIVSTETLKKLIAEKVYHRIVNGGDAGSNSMNYLFFLSSIKKVSLKLQ